MSNALTKSKQSLILKCLIAILLVSILGCLAIWKYETRETWPRLQQIDSSLSVLNEPKRLMILASTFTRTNLASHTEDVDATVDTRHEAVRALLNLQRRTFGVHTKPPSKRGTGIDHVCSWADPAATNIFLSLITTPSKQADIHATDCDYWSMEMLDFDKDGRLLNRVAYNEPSDK